MALSAERFQSDAPDIECDMGCVRQPPPKMAPFCHGKTRDGPTAHQRGMNRVCFATSLSRFPVMLRQEAYPGRDEPGTKADPEGISIRWSATSRDASCLSMTGNPAGEQGSSAAACS